MKFLPDFDTITIEYTFDKNYEKVSEILKNNVFKKSNWHYNLAGTDFDCCPKIYYDYVYFKIDSAIGIMNRKPFAELSFSDNIILSTENKMLIRIIFKKEKLLFAGFISFFFAFFFAIILYIFIVTFLPFLQITILPLLIVILFPITAIGTLNLFDSSYNQNRDKLIQNFEKLLRDNDIVYRRTNELKENPVWLQKIKKAYRAVIKWR